MLIVPDSQRIDGLQELGFVQYRQWDFINERPLGDVPTPVLPPGFAIRHATAADFAALAEVRNQTFGAGLRPEDFRRQVMDKPGYDPQREILVVDRSGAVAAFTVIWFDRRNKVGLFEPVGTSPAFQRRGLARAMMCYALGQMRQAGMETAQVEHGIDNQPALALYRSLGFTPKYKTLGFRRD